MVKREKERRGDKKNKNMVMMMKIIKHSFGLVDQPINIQYVYMYKCITKTEYRDVENME